MSAYWEIATDSVNDMFLSTNNFFSNCFFSYLGYWSGNFFMIAPFPDHCLLLPFSVERIV